MYTTDELLKSVQQLFPLRELSQVPGSDHFDLQDFPFEGMKVRVKPGSYGTFQILFPEPGAPSAEPMNDYHSLDKYFRRTLSHKEAGNFSSQIRANKTIYIYPKFPKDLDSCIRVLNYTVASIQSSAQLFKATAEEEVHSKTTRERRSWKYAKTLALISFVVLAGTVLVNQACKRTDQKT